MSLKYEPASKLLHIREAWVKKWKLGCTEEPLGAKPYLCVSAERDVTPGTAKSNAGTGYLPHVTRKIRSLHNPSVYYTIRRFMTQSVSIKYVYYTIRRLWT